MKLKNFIEENNDIPYLNGAVRIGDFSLYKNDSEKIIDDAKVGYSIYGISSLDELDNNTKKIIVVIPALTGNSKIFDSKSSQGNGWGNTYGKPNNILDPNKNIVIGLDYFGGPYDSTGPDKHNLNFYPVPPEKQVEAWKKALYKLGVKKVDMLFGGSNGGGHIHSWIFDDRYEPDYLISIAGPIAPTIEAKEFFSIQVDFVKKREDVSERLKLNLKNIVGESKLYDALVEETFIEIKENLSNWTNEKAIKVVRQIGFLKFLNPSFFDKFYYDKFGNNLDSFESAKENMMIYFENEGANFEKRFALSSLVLLSGEIVDANRISPFEYVEKISTKINLIIISIEDDNLFETNEMQKYFGDIKTIRTNRNDTGNTIISILKSDEITKKAGHDSFLWDKSINDISKMVLNNICKS